MSALYQPIEQAVVREFWQIGHIGLNPIMLRDLMGKFSNHLAII